MSKNVLILGAGLAALTCAKLLSLYGYNIEIYGKNFSNSSIININNLTYDILLQIWNIKESLLSKAYFTDKRYVLWDSQEDVSVLNQPSVTISGDVLIEICKNELTKLNPKIILNEVEIHNNNIKQIVENKSVDWIIDATGRSCQFINTLPSFRRISFGNRCILSTIIKVGLKENISCMESVPDGWIYITPIEKQKVLIQAMVLNVSKSNSHILKNLIEKSNLIRNYLSSSDIEQNQTSISYASPQISDPVCGYRWLSIGDSAVSFDPISGNGVGYVLKGTILAVAVINGNSLQNISTEECLNHYKLRLKKSILDHLKECTRYYSSTFTSKEWKKEIDMMKNASTIFSVDESDFKLWLKNFRLEKRKKS